MRLLSASTEFPLGIRGYRYSSLRNQLTRAAMSIPANIAEGRRQLSEKDFARFLRYAVNSAYELEYHLVVAQDTRAIPELEAQEAMANLVQVRKMIHGLLGKLGQATDPQKTDTKV